ncbi:MAG TPA: glycosyltransferase family 4 protein [Solirubrobacterales bacterium]|nr:glycosyltransferase family 4 protein [Solirubrobacterales bacterium]
MRLRILTHYYPPEVGAPQTRLAALAHGLARAGAEVTVHTGFPHYPDGEIKPPYRNRPLQVEQEDGVRIMRSWVYPAPNRGFARRLANHASLASAALAAAPAGGPVDVLLVETPPLILAGAAIAYARAKRARLVLNVADLWPDSAVEMGTLSSPRAIAAAQRLERAAYREAAAIACPTEGIFGELRGRAESAGKAALVRPAVDLSRFDPTAAGAERAASNGGQSVNGGSSLRVLYAGTVGLAHGLGTLIDAAEEIQRGAGTDLGVTIAGDGAEAPALRARLARRGPSGVRMLGAVPAERIPSLYAESDVAVVMLRDLPIFEGALPTKLLEAMAAGRPVLLAARGEAARLVEAESCGVVVPPEDPRALAAALTALAADPARRAAMGAAGRHAAERDFGRKAWLHRWHDLLASA